VNEFLYVPAGAGRGRIQLSVDSPASTALAFSTARLAGAIGHGGTRAGYRADIDGLRALSITAVIGFHAFPNAIRGGFVGVDVFFVISGFLITSLIVEDLERERFSFARFYERRIRRIFPALLLVLIVTFPLAWVILLPGEFQRLGKHVAGAAGFVSNFLLWGEAGYFDQAAETKPLLHLWSLAIEEQFYLVWPAVLWLAWRRKANALAITVLIGTASFAMNILATSYSGSAAFYSPATRFLGVDDRERACARCRIARVFLEEADRSRERHTGLGRRCRNSCGGVFSENPSVSRMGGAAADDRGLVADRQRPGSGPNRSFLSSRSAVWIGKISYPLYLWHWALLSFAAIAYGGAPSVAGHVLVLGASVILSVLTYALVEKPVRFGPHRRGKAIVLLLLMASVGCLGYLIIASRGFPLRAVAMANESFERDLVVLAGSRTSDDSCPILLGIQPVKREICLSSSDHPKFLILGDSHAMSFNSAVYAGRSKLRTVLLSLTFEEWNTSDCLASAPFDEWLKGGSACAGLLRHAYEVARREGPATVLIVSRYDSQFFRKWSRDIQATFLRYGKHVVYVADLPDFNTQPQRCRRRTLEALPESLAPKPPVHGWHSCSEDIEIFAAKRRNTHYPEFLASLRAADRRVLVFDGMLPFCDERSCAQADDGGVLFIGGGHLNVRAARRY
jgi:peptidoglycan/LPS O-acetylase OafA/YrhL